MIFFYDIVYTISQGDRPQIIKGDKVIYFWDKVNKVDLKAPNIFPSILYSFATQPY